MSGEIRVEDTEIQTGGVMRCCLETVANEHIIVSIGDTSSCDYCGEEFMLIERSGKRWVPKWQLPDRV